MVTEAAQVSRRGQAMESRFEGSIDTGVAMAPGIHQEDAGRS